MKVNSKHISDLNHDPLKNELHVTFHDGNSYTYQGVDSKKFNELLQAPSIGQHFRTQIKGKHAFRKKNL